ncbi:MBOAT family O-acyltransferase [Tenacibaculum sp. ZS6-P6]|uniref:MBOAT family O-acyltransferase n=1 Tax=Tenacibaculum sp. ZS6-P6 TaxID=3447503 RepID=UPI003F9569DB
MLFNSIEFAIYLPIVFILYWFVINRNLKLQNSLLVIASYVFYGWWDWRFLSLIFFSSCVDYFIGIGFSNTKNKRKRKFLLWISIFINLGFLGFFKYFNFFIESFAETFTMLGKPIEVNRLNIILPVGISFYTFQTLSYSIDIYRKKLKPTKDIISFFAFVSFFPQLVAGPIEKATNLLPQFYKKRIFKYDLAVDGMRQILWGLFKKIVIADNCAQFSNQIFANYGDYNGSTLILGAVFFTFQIYCDFSGYSDIAIGTSRLFGFNLKQNFNFPYFSRNISEFWRRWHISLNTWFKDYLYIPLGGNKGGKWKKIRNIFIVFIISGFWHGANWTFIVWGFLNACYFIPIIFLNKNKKINSVTEDKLLPTLKETLQIISTFGLTVLTWVFFRAENVSNALSYINKLISWSLFESPNNFGFSKLIVLQHIFIIIIFILIEWFGRDGKYALQKITIIKSKFYRWILYLIIVILIFALGNFSKTEFIYFTF